MDGLRIYVDPVTGQITDPPEPAAKAAPKQAAEAPPDDVRQIVHDDGAVSADTGDRFTTELYAEVIDGQLVTCHRPASPATVSEEMSETESTGQDNEQP